MRHTLCLALLALTALPAAAQAQEGLFGAFEIGPSQANIDPDADADAGLGTQVGLRFGYRWGSGLGLSAGLSAARFQYDTQAPAPAGALAGLGGLGQQATPALVDVEATLNAATLDLSAWYLLPLGDALTLGARGGLAYTEASYRALAPLEGDAVGGLGALSLSWAARASLQVHAELSWRWLGVSFDDVAGLDDPLSIAALTLGVGWGP